MIELGGALSNESEDATNSGVRKGGTRTKNRKSQRRGALKPRRISAGEDARIRSGGTCKNAPALYLFPNGSVVSGSLRGADAQRTWGKAFILEKGEGKGYWVVLEAVVWNAKIPG